MSQLLKEEKKRQEKFPWERSKHYSNYNKILGYYQAKSCIEEGQKGSILDLPCGDGTLTKIFCDHYERVVGVDASTAHLAIARKQAPNAIFFESLIEEIELQETFNSIFMINILEHVINPVEVLKHVSKFLKKDGRLIVHVPNANAINRLIAVEMGTLQSNDELSPFDINVAGHRRYYKMETLIEDISQAGLTIVKTGGIFYKMLSTAQMEWFLVNGPWQEGGFGWGRVGSPDKDWRQEFCRACYEIGKDRPEDCNIIYAVATA